jgi:GNAT superfamily N-acetyltransferase
MTEQPLIRPARESDLEVILRIYADDDLHEARTSASAMPSSPMDPALPASAPMVPAPRSEGVTPSDRERRAFRAILPDPDNQLYVSELEGLVVGTFQLTFMILLGRGGCQVAQLENVFVHSGTRSRGVGAAMVTWAIQEARRRGALRLQLTSNLRRLQAHRFYERLGFHATHKGMKLYLG